MISDFLPLFSQPPGPTNTLLQTTPLPLGGRTNPVNLSSSTTSIARNVLRQAINHPNTGVRKRTSNAHQVMAEATAKGSDKLVNALKKITITNKEVESMKMDLHMEIYSANLDNKCKWDQAVVENSRISLLHQSTVVQAISSLIEALARLNPPRVPNSAPAQAESPTIDIAALLPAPHDRH